MTITLRPLAALLLLSALGSRLSAQDGQVVFERTGYRLTSIGGRVSVAARVLDARRRAVPNAPIAWRIEDPAVARVSDRGVVESRRVGRTRLWAVSGRDSASALILVDQWAARFAFSPAVVSFAAVGGSRQVQVQARDASGNAIPGIRIASACRILNPRVATIASNGQVTAQASGTTYLRCTDRGVADSLRIEVRQRPASAAIADKGFYTTPRTVGDSFQVRMRATDAAGNLIADARPTWASLEPRVVNIDPLTGWARGVGVGASKIVAQVGDITDTVDVSVVAGAGMNLTPVVLTGEETAAAPTANRVQAQLNIYSIPTAVGDTTSLTIVARDTLNALAEASAVRLRISGDTGIARLTRDRRLVGLKEGQVYIVGSFAGITDSLAIAIRPRGSTARGEENVAFIRPSFDTAAAVQRNRQQLDSAQQAILAGSVVRVSTGRMISAQALVAQAAHAARLSETYVEKRSGLLFGGRVLVAPFRRLNLAGNFRIGTLTADASTPAEDMRLTEVEGMLTFSPATWLSLQGGATLRGQGTDVATQHWQFVTASVLLHPRLIGDNFRTIAGFSIIPVGSLKESKDGPTRPMEASLAGEAGLEFNTGFFNAALLYHSERLSFPAEDTANQRVDRFSMLRVRLGFQIGR